MIWAQKKQGWKTVRIKQQLPTASDAAVRQCGKCALWIVIVIVDGDYDG